MASTSLRKLYDTKVSGQKRNVVVIMHNNIQQILFFIKGGMKRVESAGPAFDARRINLLTESVFQDPGFDRKRIDPCLQKSTRRLSARLYITEASSAFFAGSFASAPYWA